MITALIFSLFILTNCKQIKEDQGEEKEIGRILTKYIAKVPDVNSKYIINEGLSKAISEYYKGKISTFPLFKISLKIDRKPVKIPWALEQVDRLDEASSTNTGNIQYKYVKKDKD